MSSIVTVNLNTNAGPINIASKSRYTYEAPNHLSSSSLRISPHVPF